MKKNLVDIIGKITGAAHAVSDQIAYERLQAERGIKPRNEYDRATGRNYASANRKAFLESREREREEKKQHPLMTQEIRLVDREELRHYQSEMMRKNKEKKPVEELEKQHRAEMFRLMLGDRSDLDTHRIRNSWADERAHFDGKRDEVRKMSVEKLREIRDERVAQMERGGLDIGNDRW